MKNWLWLGPVAVAVAPPGLNRKAEAQSVGNYSIGIYGRSNAAPSGEYAFGVTAYTPPGLPSGPPSVATGIKYFDGKGNLTQRDYRGNSVPAQFAPYRQEKAPIRCIPTAPAAW